MGVLHSMGSKGDSIEKQTSDYVAKKQELEWRSAPPTLPKKNTRKCMPRNESYRFAILIAIFCNIH